MPAPAKEMEAQGADPAVLAWLCQLCIRLVSHVYNVLYIQSGMKPPHTAMQTRTTMTATAVAAAMAADAPDDGAAPSARLVDVGWGAVPVNRSSKRHVSATAATSSMVETMRTAALSP